MFPLLSVFSVVLATLLWGQVSAKTNQTIVQLFEWPHASVGAECASLASAGYGYAQVSPELLLLPHFNVSHAPLFFAEKGIKRLFLGFATSRAYSRVGMVDRLSACLLSTEFETRESCCLYSYGKNLQRGWDWNLSRRRVES